jgi:metal-sulfur cluster biosynthetic enzyme
MPKSSKPADVMPQAEPPLLDEAGVRKALRAVKDPEVGLNIIDLGLVYDVDVTEGKVDVRMTLTSPGCPVGPQIMMEADEVVRAMKGVEDVRIELVWEPYWTPERIDPKVRSYLGY